MSSINQIASGLYKALSESDERKVQPYDVKATVLREDGNIVWVKIPGGVDETPVQKTNNANAGDDVMVRISGGRAWLLGNETSPATDNTVANAATQLAEGAGDLARTAADSATEAQQSAQIAYNYANQAHDEAERAYEEAENAHGEAVRATGYANNALAGLSTVESVVDVVNWFSNHKVASTDTTVDNSKTYYIYNPTTGTLSEVVPAGTENPSQEGWYELNEAISNYVASHIAQTEDGLYVVGLSNGWKVLVSSGAGDYTPGIFLIDPTGNIAQATTANSITFDQDKSFTIGDSNASIIFDGDGHITITGSGVTFGSQSMGDVLSELDSSIKSIEYGKGSSATSHSDITSWSTATPTWEEGKYIWMRTTTNGLTYTYTCIQGAKGEDGQPGSSGTSVTVSSITYAVSTTETQPADSAFTYNTVPTVAEGSWLWTKTLYSDGSKAYTKSKQGAKGQDGAPGTAGTSITITNIRYAVSTTETQPADSAFTYTSVPTVAEGNWLWTRTLYSDNSKVYTKAKQGAKGQDGAAGTSVTVESISYAVSTTETQPADSSFTYTSVPTVAEGSWLWTKTEYSDNSKVYTKAKQGAKGEDGQPGAAGTSVTVSSITYAVSTTETQPADSAFTNTSVPTVAEGSWLWTKTLYSDGSKAYTKSKQGVKGQDGAPGAKGEDGTSVTVSSITYAVSTTETQPVDSAFTATTVPTVAEGSWLWTKTEYSDGSKIYTKSKQGKSGTNGTSVTVTKIEYGTSSSASTSPSSWSTTAPTSLTKGTWLWIKTTYSDSSTATAKNYIGTDGSNGTTFTPSVDANGNISWTNDGGKTNPTTRNIKGPQGDAGDDGQMLYATSSTASDASAKTATLVDGTLTLEAGAIVAVTFTNENEATAPTLNVSNTGAKAIKSYSGGDLSTGESSWSAGACLLFVYDGTYWRLSDSGSTAGLETAFNGLGEAESNISDLSGQVSDQQLAIGSIQGTVDAHSTTLSSQSADISNLQNGQTTINNNIANINSVTQNLDERTDAIEGAVVIDPSEPSVTVLSSNSSVKIASARVTIKSGGNSVAFAESNSEYSAFVATRGVFQEMRPRTITMSGSTVTLTGSLAFIARANGHLSLKKVNN